MNKRKSIDKFTMKHILTKSQRTLHLSPTEIRDMTERMMVKNLAEHIIQNRDELPILFEMEEDTEGEQTYKLEAYLISKEELMRLKEIEWMYVELNR